MQKQKRRATFPRATGAFLFWKVGGVFFFFLFAFQPPHQKEVPRFFLRGGHLSTKDHTGHHTYTRTVCVCALWVFSSFVITRAQQQPTSLLLLCPGPNGSVNLYEEEEETQFLAHFHEMDIPVFLFPNGIWPLKETGRQVTWLLLCKEGEKTGEMEECEWKKGEKKKMNEWNCLCVHLVNYFALIQSSPVIIPERHFGFRWVAQLLPFF